MNFPKAAPGSPEQTLMDLKSGSQTYASVFEMLCSFAGLHCVTISGFAKGVDYTAGMQFHGKEALHSWNSVLIHNQWQLVDTHWAARRMVGKRSLENLRYELDEFFFMTSPRQLIYTHFPHDPEWQLLENRVSLQEFEQLPPVKSLFFKLGLKFVGDNGRAILEAPYGERLIQLKFNSRENPLLDFNFALSTDDGREDIEAPGGQVKLNRFVLHEMNGSDIASFLIRLPNGGDHRFVVFATPKNSDLNMVDKQDRAYSAVCEWKIKATRPATYPAPFPSCSAQRWGPPLEALAEQRGVTGLPSEAKLYTDSRGIVEFSITKCDPKQAILCAGKLRAYQGFDESTLDTAVLQRNLDDGKAVFTVSAPGRGEFGIDIFTTRQDDNGKANTSGQKTLFHLCQYLIICEEPAVSGLRFPPMPAGYLGPQKTFSELELSVISHKDPFIILPSLEKPLELVFGQKSKSHPVRAVASLLLLTPGKTETKDFSEYILHQTPLNGSRIAFVCRFPKPGMYKLQIFAQATDAAVQADSIPGVFNYLVDVARDQTQILGIDGFSNFPKQYSQWHEGGFLVEPLDGVLKRETATNRLLVRLAIPRARKVAVVVADTWTHLNVGADGIWEGVVVLDKAWANPKAKQLFVSANFQIDNPNAYSTLLEYKLE